MTAFDEERFRAAVRRRRAARLWGLVIGVPLALAGLALVAKIVTMYVFAHQTIAASARDDAPAAVAAAEAQQPFNVFDRWRAPYNLGVALAEADQLPGARAQLERALELASGLDVCPAGLNLALVIERQGLAVENEDPAQTSALFAEALAVVDALPEECGSDEAAAQSPDPSRDPAQMRDDLRERLQQTPPPEPSDEQGDDEEEEQPQDPADDEIEQLEDQLEKGAEEREKRDQRNDGDGENSGFPEGDKPW